MRLLSKKTSILGQKRRKCRKQKSNTIEGYRVGRLSKILVTGISGTTIILVLSRFP